MVRRYGPTRGAGVVIEEQSGDKPISPGALGFVGYAGILERGNPGELIIALDKTTYTRKCGGRIADSLLPDACIDYYDGAAGAGGILLVRVTDGNEQASELPVYTRQLPRTQLGWLRAKNGGRWGGKEKHHTAQVTDEAADITATTVITGLSTFTTDEWKGGYLELAGVPNKRYNITGNTAAGVISVDSDQDMEGDLAAGDDPTNDRYYLVLENEGFGLSAMFTDGDENPTAEFGLVIFDNGARRKTYPNLSTDPTSGRYWVDVINDDTGNDWVEAEDLWTGAHVASARPANLYGEFSALTATVLTAVIHDFTINSPTNGDPTMALGTTTDDMLSQVITLTMTNATNFTASSDRFGTLGSGVFGSLFTPNNKWTPPFTVTAGATPMVAADTITIVYRPFKADSLIGGRLYPDKDGDRRLFYRIIDNDRRTITVAAGSDMATDVAPVVAAAATGSIQFVALASMVDGETLTLTDADGTSITFEFDATGAHVPGGGNVEIDISGATDAQSVAVIAQAAINGAAIDITAAVPVGGLMALSQDNTGSSGNTAIGETVANAGFIVTAFTGGEDDSTDEYMVEAPLEFIEGRDGNADISDSDYAEQAWDTTNSPFLRVVGRNLGLIKFATPGVTSTAVQRAGVAYAEAKNHQYRYEVPANVVTEQAADEYINDTLGRSDYAVVSFPSQGYVADPDSTEGRLKLVSLTGQIHGAEANVAKNWNGYHKAAAGNDVKLPKLLELPTGDAVLNEEYLNPLGINVIKKKKGNFVLWGDRTLWTDPTWTWKHQRELMSYYEQVLMEAFDFIVFAINDPQEQDTALTSLKSFFLPEWQPKRALRGNKFEDAASLRVDNELNTDATRAAGDMIAEVKLQLADTVERFIIRIGKQGLFESVA